MKKTIAMLLTAALSASLLSGCVSTSQNTTAAQSAETSSADTSSADGSSADKTGKSTAESSADSASYTIGVGQFAEHGSLDNCREGFMAGLEEEGIEEGVNLTVLYDNSQADGGTASQIATNFIGKGVDLMCGIATPMAQAEYGVAKKSDIPVIFTAVTDPVAAELANADGTPVGEITGTSDKLPVDTGISSSADIALAADTLISKVDCITNLTDNTVVASLPVILDKAAAKNIPVFGSEIEQVKIGCLAAMGLDYIELGRQTGKMAAQVLRGEKKASEMNYETIKEAAFYGNTRVAGNLGITLPEDLTKNAAELFTEIAQ